MAIVTKESYKKRGKLGDVVHVKGKYKSIARGAPGPRTKKPGHIVLDQNLRLQLMSKFLAKYTSSIAIGFQNKRGKMNPLSEAQRYNIRNAIIGDSPQFEIDFPRIIFSKGNRETAWSGEISFEDRNLLKITWEVLETANKKVVGKDKVCALIYNSTKCRSVYNYGEAIRSSLLISTRVAPSFGGNTFHVWLFFVSADGKSVSNTEYMGSTTMPL